MAGRAQNDYSTPLEFLDDTIQPFADHPQAIPASSQLYGHNNGHHNTSALRLLTPNAVASGHSPDMQNWPIPDQFYTQDPLCSPSTFLPPLPSQMCGDPVVLPHVHLEVANHRTFMANDGPYAYPIQTQPGQALSWALPVDRLLPWDPLPPPVYPSIIPPPPSVNANGPAMFESSTPVSEGVPQKPLDTARTESGQIQYASSSRATDPQPHLPCGPPPPEACRYKSRGKYPAAKFEPDAVKLQALCERRGGSAFAVARILVIFAHSVTKEALIRTLDPDEIDEMGFHGGFRPRQAYDGFISKIGSVYQCGLCKEGEKVCWKNKKDAPRHLRKFHFGLADPCKICKKQVYSNGEMKNHVCQPVSAAGGTSGAA